MEMAGAEEWRLLEAWRGEEEDPNQVGVRVAPDRPGGGREAKKTM